MIPLPTLADVDKEEITRKGLSRFVQLAWPLVEPKSHSLIWNWHMDAICDHVQALFRGQIQYLLITVPPRTSKSLTCAVFAPAWAWTFDPSLQLMYASYAQNLSNKHSVKCRALIESPWYKQRWGTKFQMLPDQNQKHFFENNLNGFRFATSTGGTVTGEGGDIFTYDDLLNIKDASSAAAKETCSTWFWEVSSSRLNDLKTGRKLVINQRIAPDDITAEILNREGSDWCHLNLPMRHDPTISIETSIGFTDPRREGEILDPIRFSEEKLNFLEKSLGSYAYSAQYQQSPVPRGGGIVKEDWFGWFECEMNIFELMKREPVFLFQSWDCASKAKDSNDPTVGITLAAFKDHLELWDYDLERTIFPDTQKRIRQQAFLWRPRFILIEDKDSGQSHIQELQKKPDAGEKPFPFKIIAYNPGKLDKFSRMSAQTPLIEQGRLWLPKHLRKEKLDNYVKVMTTFTSATTRNDDLVDATSQALDWYQNEWSVGAGLYIPGPGGSSGPSEHTIY